MAINLKNSFSVPLPIAEAWNVLLDIKRVISCMPGAELLEVVDDRTYRALVKAALGPVKLAFKGLAKIEEIDEPQHRLRIKASGNENSGRGGAQADILVTLAPATENATAVHIATDLALTGAVAQYGRGIGMIQDVSRHLIDKFAENLRVQIQGSEEERREAAARSGQAVSAFEVARAGLSGTVRRIWKGSEPEDSK